MTLKPKELKAQARQALDSQVGDPRRLTLLHEGVLVGAGFLLILLNALTVLLMDQAGGLSGMGIRSTLSTVINFADLLVNMLTPFWSFGLLSVALAFARSQQVQSSALLGGFRRFGPVLRLLILEVLLYTGVILGIIYVGSIFVSLLPTSPEFLAFLDTHYEAFMENPEAVLAQMPTELMLSSLLLPTLVITGLLLIVLIPLTYRLRLCEYAIMDDPDTGALAALSFSMRKMKGNCLTFFKLDLSFWWYSVLTLLLSGVLNLDSLLPQLGIALPMNAELFALICYAVYAVGVLALYWFAAPSVITTYAKAYENIRDE